MNPLEDRYSRQRRLPELGRDGQRRLEGARFNLGTGPAAVVELSYLCRAGARRLSMSYHPIQPAFPHTAAFRHSSAGIFANGTWRALTQIKAATRER